MNSFQKISAVIITFNEEQNIKRCIDSLTNVVDEIIVIDSFSTDNTKDICETLGVKFIQTKWQGYSKTKNYGNNLAVNDWIFSIDADEELSSELQEDLKLLKEKKLAGVYEVKRLNNYCGQWIKHAGWYPDKKIRLFNKKECSWTGEIHETLTRVTSKKTLLKGDLLHYSYYKKEEFVDRIAKYSKLQAEEAFKKGKKISLFKKYLSAIVKFIEIYIYKLGILDGRAGFEIATINAKGKRLKAYYLKELRK